MQGNTSITFVFPQGKGGEENEVISVLPSMLVTKESGHQKIPGTGKCRDCLSHLPERRYQSLEFIRGPEDFIYLMN